MKSVISILLFSLFFISNAIADSSHTVYYCYYNHLKVNVVHVSDNGKVTVSQSNQVRTFNSSSGCSDMADRLNGK